jgi:hypothetical protein
MPSIQDIADQINVKLDSINNNTSATVAVGNGIRNDIHALDGDLQAGVVALAGGIFAIWELQKVTNSILDHHTKQNDTVICLLENTNDLLCGITRKFTRQLALSEKLVKSIKRLEGIAERTDAQAAGDFDRQAKLEAQILKCCPPEEPPLEPCPEPCPISRPTHYPPRGQEWQPPRPPNQIG